METLLELLPRIRELGPREAARFSNGLRTWTFSYDDLYVQIGAVAGFLDGRGLRKRDRVVLWCENRPEWVSVFWACVARGIELVPVDAQTPSDRVGRILDEVGARLLVRGPRTPPGKLWVQTLEVAEIAGLPSAQRFSVDPADPNDVVEILFTSGTTADPKGVIHRHRNIAANLTPIAREIQKYERWARPFQPVRILDMLPFSHMFGQSMGLFIPPLLGGSVVVSTEMHPAALRRRIRQERVSVLVAVPRLLKSLETDARRRHATLDFGSGPSVSVGRRIWRYRSVHRDFGWKFWAMVVGGAELPAETEAFWLGMGFTVVQGYGLTETSPVIAVNHPLHTRRGTVGKALGDQEVRIAEDGEILVRGPSIVSEYLGTGGARQPVTDPEGWFHTGDVGTIDAEGHLVFRGRKKDMIVLSDGFNVYPEDVERILGQVPGVQSSVVVPVHGPDGERVHAALILEDDIQPNRIVEEANRRLLPQQRIRSWSLWPDADFPRTPSTLKVQRHHVAARVRDGSAPAMPPAGSAGGNVREILSGITGRRAADFAATTTLGEELGLSSLERVDLQALIEEQYGVDLDETGFSEATTIGDLESQVRSSRRADRGTDPVPGPVQEAGDAPRLAAPVWTRSRALGLLRRCVQAIVIQPLLAPWVRLEIDGLENLDPASSPVIFAATHQSHFDVPVFLRALPQSLRRRIAPAMSQEYFLAPGGWVSWRRALEYYLALGLFNAYPLPRRPGQIRQALAYTGDLISHGYCPLVFPEGRRSSDEAVETFQPGIGFMAVHLEVPVVPVRITGLSRILPVGGWWPRRGSTKIVFGAMLRPLDGETYSEFASRLEDRVRELS